MNTERIMGKTRAVAMATVALLALILACTCFTSQAFANRTIEAPTTPNGERMTVSDDITRIQVNKLDYDTHEFVQGAKMAIIDKETNVPVFEWVTDGSTYQCDKGLDVNKVYILREYEAPDGFEKVDIVEFFVNEEEGTGITIVNPDLKNEEVDWVDYSGYVVNLYDRAKPIEDEIVVTETRGTSSSNTTSGTTKNPAPKTGDETPLWPIIALVVVGIIGIGVLEIPKRRIKE